jgi:hypothetical protein
MMNWKVLGRKRLWPNQHTVEHLLKARTVEAKKQPLLGNARTQQ